MTFIKLLTNDNESKPEELLSNIENKTIKDLLLLGLEKDYKKRATAKQMLEFIGKIDENTLDRNNFKREAGYGDDENL